MRSPVIVVVEEVGQFESALDGGWIRAAVRPAAEEGLDEALGFSICAGAMRACA